MIPDEAVEAAWDTLHENAIRPIGIDYAELTAALEAAAPFIAAQALKEAADAWRAYLPAVAGYGVVQPVPVWLERRGQWASKGV